MNPLPMFLLILATLCVGPAALNAQPGASKSTPGKLLSELDLSPTQEGQIRAIVVSANKSSIRLKADIEIAGIDLRAALDEASVSEEKVGKLIQKISALEGELRTSRTISWVRMRKILSTQQRRKLDAHKQNDETGQMASRSENLSGRRTEGPLRSAGQESTLVDPFGSRDEGSTLESPFTSRKQVSTVKEPFRATNAPATAATCDEVSCLVDPTRSCCKSSTLMVTTSPTAAIYIDGKKVGMSPLEHKLRPGTHKVKAVFENGAPAKLGTIQIKAGARQRISWISDGD